MRAIVLAYHNIGCTGLEALLHHGFEVAAVFTHRDDPGENVWFRSVAECAAAHGLPVYAPEDINHPVWVQRIQALKPDILFSFYYRRLVRGPLLALPPSGCLNLHGSLLPRYRGRCPINWVLVHGESETGVTLHEMTPRPDDGDILGQRRIPITPDDTARTLMDKADRAAGLLLDELLPLVRAGRAPRTPQDPAQATYFGGRRPADGVIRWDRDADSVRNLVRAVTRPYPGAFTYRGDRKYIVWAATVVPDAGAAAAPGTILAEAPLVVRCGQGALRIDCAQAADGVLTTGAQLAADEHLLAGMCLGPAASERLRASRRRRVLILGVNGFIGNALSERLLDSGRYEVHGMDLAADRVQRFLGHPAFHFDECDIAIHREWLEYHIRTCDVVVPLIAIATPIEYTRNPLRVFELDFEENLRVVRYCVKYGRRIVFPSTSEVYGMCTDAEFDEDRSNCVLGPVRMQRWIYSCSKQLLDRVIWAYGQQHQLRFTLFRPFNWIGPRLDSLHAARIGSSRVITQIILNLVEGTPILLIDGGEQKRCFTDVGDGIDCLCRILADERGTCDGRIFNIGNPAGELSIRELAELLVRLFAQHPLRSRFPPFAGYKVVDSASYYGRGYQDVQSRRPSIRNAQRLLDWNPRVAIADAVARSLDFFLEQAVAEAAAAPAARAPGNP